jgi:hypothetical protein
MSQHKISLVFQYFNHGISGYSFIRYQLLKHFNIEFFDPGKTYHPSTHIMVVDQYERNRNGFHWLFQQSGFRVIVDCFWDTHKGQLPHSQDRVLRLCAPEWIWIYEYFLNAELGYSNRVQQGAPDKFFLLLMNLRRDARERLFKQVTQYLDHSLYSYRARGIFIDGDRPLHTNGVENTSVNQKFSNLDWYNSTNFSLVSEAFPEGTQSEKLFVSEKTFKPLRLNHPFVVFGSCGTLRYLHGLGFETFDHVLDESYDLVLDAKTRLHMVDQQLHLLYQEFQQGKYLFGDSESQKKMQHNFARFYDKSVVTQLWQTQVVDVIQEFAHGQ